MSLVKAHLTLARRFADRGECWELVDYLDLWITRINKGWYITEGSVERAIFMLNNYKSTSQRMAFGHLNSALRLLVEERNARLDADGWVD
jgi:hypothetical protein